MYKKITAFLLIFILLFNFIAIEKVKAEALTLGVSFLIFAGLLTITGVTLTSMQDIKFVYGQFQKDIGIHFEAFKIMAKTLYQSIISLGSNFQIDWQESNLARFKNWVAEKFSPGIQEIIIGESLSHFIDYEENAFKDLEFFIGIPSKTYTRLEPYEGYIYIYTRL